MSEVSNSDKDKKKELKKLIKEEKRIDKKDKQKAKKKTKEFKRLTAEKEKVVEIRKKRHIFEFFVILVFLIVMLVLLVNKTFFRETYKTDKININIPLLTYFIKDDGNQVVLKTLRKSQYVEEYFDTYLSNLTRYNCQNTYFYYNENTKTAIFDIKVEKKFVVKTVKINYRNGNADCICSSPTTECE